MIAVPAAVFARDDLRRHPPRRAARGADGRLLPGAGRPRDGARPGDVPRLLGADDAGAGEPRSSSPASDARCAAPSSSTWRSPTSAASACGSRCSRSPTTGRSTAPPLSDGLAARLVAVAAIVGFGTKAGADAAALVAAARAPGGAGHVSALMSGVMIKVALYGLIRVAVRVGGARRRSGSGLVAARARRCCPRSGGVLYALVQHDLKRLLAFHSIENVGIIALGLGASLLFAAGDQPPWARSPSPRRCCTSLNHAVFKALLFLGAGAFERAVGALDLDRLGGLLRRMPWTGGRVPDRGDGDRRAAAAQRLRLGVADAAVAAPRRRRGPVRRGAGRGGSPRRRWRRPRRWPCSASSRWSGSSCSARRGGRSAPPPRSRRRACARRWSSWPACASLLGVAPGLLVPTLAELGPGDARLAEHAGLAIPGTGSLPALALALGSGALRPSRSGGWPPARRAPRRPPGPAGSGSSRRWRGRSAGFTKPLRLVLESVLRPRARARPCAAGAARPGGRAIEAEVPHLFDTLALRAGLGGGAAGGCGRAPPAVRQPARLRRLPAGAGRRAAGARAAGSARMSAAVAGAVQVGGVALAPLLPGIDPARQGAPAGPPRTLAAAALPRAAPPVGQEPLVDPSRAARSTELAPPVVAASLLVALRARPDRRPLARVAARQRRHRARRPAGARHGSRSRRRRGTPAAASR